MLVYLNTLTFVIYAVRWGSCKDAANRPGRTGWDLRAPASCPCQHCAIGTRGCFAQAWACSYPPACCQSRANSWCVSAEGYRRQQARASSAESLRLPQAAVSEAGEGVGDTARCWGEETWVSWEWPLRCTAVDRTGRRTKNLLRLICDCLLWQRILSLQLQRKSAERPTDVAF